MLAIIQLSVTGITFGIKTIRSRDFLPIGFVRNCILFAHFGIDIQSIKLILLVRIAHFLHTLCQCWGNSWLQGGVVLECRISVNLA